MHDYEYAKYHETRLPMRGTDNKEKMKDNTILNGPSGTAAVKKQKKLKNFAGVLDSGLV